MNRRSFLRASFRAPAVDGRARVDVDTTACLTYFGQVCSVCVERCPTPTAVRLDGLHPHIDAAACTGCGECVARCPAPRPALRLRAATGG